MNSHAYYLDIKDNLEDISKENQLSLDEVITLHLEIIEYLRQDVISLKKQKECNYG